MRSGFFALLLCCSSAFALACDYPATAPEVPDGKTATKEQMMTGQQGVKDYVGKMEAYLACLNESLTALGEAATEADKTVHAEKHNAAVDAMQVVADKFNVEVRAFKEAQAASGS